MAKTETNTTWTPHQRNAAFMIVYNDLRAAAGFFAFMVTPNVVKPVVDSILNAPDKQHAYDAAWKVVEEKGYSGQVTADQVRREVDKAWAAALAAH